VLRNIDLGCKLFHEENSKRTVLALYGKTWRLRQQTASGYYFTARSGPYEPIITLCCRGVYRNAECGNLCNVAVWLIYSGPHLIPLDFRTQCAQCGVVRSEAPLTVPSLALLMSSPAWPIPQSSPLRYQSVSERLHTVCRGLLMEAARMPVVLQRILRRTSIPWRGV